MISTIRHAALAGATFCLLALAGGLCAQDAGPEQPEGRIHVDVVVTDATGKPVSGLRERDFKLLDGGKERNIASFAAYDGVHAMADPPVLMILVIDCVNNGFVEQGYIRQGLTKFLRQNEGRLAQPTKIVRFTLSGAQDLSAPTSDGNELAGIVDQIGPAIKPKGLDDFSLSMRALSTLVNQVANRPGRKMLIWLGAGWPTPASIGQVFTPVNARDQRAEYHLVVQFAKAMEEGRIALFGGFEGADFYLRDYLKPVQKASQTDPRDLALAVLAVKSGGHGELPAINRDSVVSDVLNKCVAEARTFYSLSFDPPRTRKADEFRQLKVAVANPGLTVHAITGYYDEPEYFRPEPKNEKTIIVDQPAMEEPGDGQRLVTVAQLTEIIAQAKRNHDSDAANEIKHLELTERLSSPELALLNAELPGAKSKSALMAVGDESAFLEPPPEEIPQKSAPDLAEQKQMMSQVVDYLKKIVPKLPDFYARRFTTSFEEIWRPEDEKGSHRPGSLHSAGVFSATVYYRGHKEVVHEEGAAEHGLVTRGTFGPILSTVIVDAAHSTTQWSRWEKGPNGPMAVFRFRVPQEESHYQVSGSGEFDMMLATAYHGEIGLDPGSGTILRLVLIADPLGSSIERADIMVEYGAVAIGGKVYTRPLRSVSYSIGALAVPAAFGVGRKPAAARLNDVVFSDYHVFRTEMRIVP